MDLRSFSKNRFNKYKIIQSVSISVMVALYVHDTKRSVIELFYKL